MSPFDFAVAIASGVFAEDAKTTVRLVEELFFPPNIKPGTHDFLEFGQQLEDICNVLGLSCVQQACETALTESKILITAHELSMAKKSHICKMQIHKIAYILQPYFANVKKSKAYMINGCQQRTR